MQHRTRRADQAWTGSLAVAALGLSALAAAVPPPGKALPSPVPPHTLSPYAKHILALGPAGYWRLGEAKGPTAYDWTSHKHNGVYHGRAALHQAGAIKNDPDRAVGLSGKAYVQIPSDAAFSAQHGLTVEAWLRPDILDFPGETRDPYVHWLGKGDKGRLEWGFRFYSRKRPDGTPSARPNRISAYLWNASGGQGAGAYFEEPVTPGQWIHVVAVYEPPGKGAGVRIYRDGVFKKGPPDKGALYRTYGVVPTPGTAPLRLGTRDLQSFLTGGLDEVAIYPRVLTPAEIRANYQLGARGGAGKGGPLHKE
jgi:hypothetical protein